MILRRKVMPSMRGISTSRVMTSGATSSMRLAAAKGSPAAPMTSMAGPMRGHGQRLSDKGRIIDNQHANFRFSSIVAGGYAKTRLTSLRQTVGAI